MLHGLVATRLRRELPRLQVGIRRHPALLVVLRQRKHAVIQRVEAGQGDELEFVAHGAQLSLKSRELRVAEVALPVERRRAIVGEQFAGILFVNRLGELPRLGEIRLRRLEPKHIGIGRVRAGARDRRFHAVSNHQEAFRRVLTGAPAPVVLVDIARQQPGAIRIGAGDEHRVHAAHVRGEARGDQLGDELTRGDEHLAAQMAAFLHRRQLILEVHAGGAGGDHQLHQLIGVEHAAEPRLGIGDQRYVPVDGMVAVHVMDFVGAPQRILNPADQVGYAVGGVQALVGVHGQRAVGVRRDLPAADVDRLEPGADFLHRLVSRDGRQHGDVGLFAQQFPQARRTMTRERVLDRERAAEPVHVFRGVAARDPLPAPVVVPPEIELLDEFSLTPTAPLLSVIRDVHTSPR